MFFGKKIEERSKPFEAIDEYEYTIYMDEKNKLIAELNTLFLSKNLELGIMDLRYKIHEMNKYDEFNKSYFELNDCIEKIEHFTDKINSGKFCNSVSYQMNDFVKIMRNRRDLLIPYFVNNLWVLP